jgi:hypothetical protein
MRFAIGTAVRRFNESSPEGAQMLDIPNGQ